MLERELERKLVSSVEKLGGLCWKFTSPGTAGVPDRICVLPGGRIIFVEMKQEFGRLASIQAYRITQLKDRNADARVVKGRAALTAFLEEIRQ